MFVKPFRTKSNSAIRGSDKKRLRNEIEQSFKGYSFEEPMNVVIPNKEEINVLKLYTYGGESVSVYFVSKQPLLFEAAKKLYPSVYFLWKYHGLLPSITTHQLVISKLANGADLMLPGVVIPESGELQYFEKGQIVGICAEGNYSQLAVGVALMSSTDITNCEEKRGKAVQVLHVFGDQLWMQGSKIQPPTTSSPLQPSVEPNEQTVNTGNLEFKSAECLSNMEPDLCEELSSTNVDCLEEKSADVPDIEVSDNIETPEMIAESMDNILNLCFMTALKKKLKDNELPILSSTFYRLYVLPCCPTNEILEIKKSSYKKLSKYLKHVESSGLIKVEELTTGSDSIVFVDRSHKDLQYFKPMPLESKDKSCEEPNTESSFGVLTQKHYEAPNISMLYGVNATTLPLFALVGCGKGTTLSPQDIRKLVTTYVKENNLIEGSRVHLDPVLHQVILGRGHVDVTTMPWDEIFKILFDKMQLYHQLQFSGISKPIVKKGPPPSIDISTMTRTGNKKVTVIKNLESFMISPQSFMDKVRKVAQASTSLTVLPSNKPNQQLQQILIQGNQVKLIDKILTGDQYGIPRKYLKIKDNLASKNAKKGSVDSV